MNRPLLALLLLAAAPALADLPPPDIRGCDGKSAGASCTRDDGTAGACAESTCTRNDYSGGPPPKQVSYACVKCVAGSPAASGDKKAGCAAAPGLSLGALAAWLAPWRRRRQTP